MSGTILFLKSGIKAVLLVFLFLTAAISFGYSEVENSNYYLGVLAEGYPDSLVISELRFANAQVVGIKDNMVLFGVNPRTKLTTFLKNLPFLKEVYVDAGGIKGNSSLTKNPLVGQFFSLLRRGSFKMPSQFQGKRIPAKEIKQVVDRSGSFSPPGKSSGKLVKESTAPDNMVLIDRLIREKAKRNLQLKTASSK